jgi:sirohydrochlorin cobaltochelatase
VGHGTSEPLGQRDFWTTVRQVARLLPETTVAGCFLEQIGPDIDTALAALAHRGLDAVVLAPLLLFAAGHARRDIPAIARVAGARLGLHLRQADVLGCHHHLVQLSATRFRAVLSPEVDPQHILLLMVGRGSQDPDATAAMYQFVDQRLAHTPVGRALVAFLAMARPRVEDVLREVAAAPYEHVVVQPHLLYRGALWDRLARLVHEQDAASPRQRWSIADCLGCDWAVAAVVVERFRRAVRPG